MFKLAQPKHEDYTDIIVFPKQFFFLDAGGPLVANKKRPCDFGAAELAYTSTSLVSSTPSGY